MVHQSAIPLNGQYGRARYAPGTTKLPHLVATANFLKYMRRDAVESGMLSYVQGVPIAPTHHNVRY